MNKEIAKLLNENTYDEDEIESYMNFSDIDDNSLNRITNDVRTRIARGGLKKSGLRAQEMLEQGEFIEKTIKGTDIDVLEDSMMINMIAKIQFMSGDGYSFNRLMFCTNKRIIITSANYYNNPFITESYFKEEIKKISLGKKVKRQFRLKRLLESNLSLAKALITLVAAIPFLFSIGVAGGTLAVGIYFATKSEFLALLGFYSAILGLGYIVVVRPKLITEVLLETKDGKSCDVIIRNEDYKEIHECFNDELMSIWENIDCYDETKGELRNFLISIAKFRALDNKRKISKQKINLELKDELYKDPDNIQIDDEGFYELIENLKEKDKVIFVKKYLLDESVEKIAKDINMAKDTVYKRLIRGREKIKEYIEN